MEGDFCRLIQFYLILLVLVLLHWTFLLRYVLSDFQVGPLESSQSWSSNSGLYGSCLILLAGSTSLQVYLRRLRVIHGVKHGRSEASVKCWTLIDVLLLFSTFLNLYLLCMTSASLLEIGSVALLAMMAVILGVYWAEVVMKADTKDTADSGVPHYFPENILVWSMSNQPEGDKKSCHAGK